MVVHRMSIYLVPYLCNLEPMLHQLLMRMAGVMQLGRAMAATLAALGVAAFLAISASAFSLITVIAITLGATCLVVLLAWDGAPTWITVLGYAMAGVAAIDSVVERNPSEVSPWIVCLVAGLTTSPQRTRGVREK